MKNRDCCYGINKRILFHVFLFLMIVLFVSPTEAATNNMDEVVRQAVGLARQGGYDDALALLKVAVDRNPEDLSIRGDYIVVLSWAGRDREAIKQFETMPDDYNVAAYVRRAVAKSYRNLKNYSRSIALYKNLLQESGKDADAARGLALAYADVGSVDKALEILDRTLRATGDHGGLLFTKASLLWRKKDYIGALRCYDAILRMEPGNSAARNLRTRVLSDMGAVSLAEEYADNTVVQDETILRLLRKNKAASYINWGEPQIATNILAELIAESEDSEFQNSCKFDLVLALHAMDKMEAVVELYEEIESEQVDIPFWIKRAAAGAYLYLRNPGRAEELYESVVGEKPEDFDGRIGLFHTYVETARYGLADEVRAKLEKETPEWIWERGVLRYNWRKDSVTVNKGWLLAYQDRKSEAEAVFKSLLEKAPANLSCRTGLGHVRLWRGWPHLALEDFNIIVNMGGDDPIAGSRADHFPLREMAARNGRLVALNDCYLKEEARERAQWLLEENPKNRHTQRINEAFEIEDSPQLYIDAVWTDEDPGVGEYYFYSSLTEPITTGLSLYAYYLKRRIESFDRIVRHERIGAGASVDVFSELTVSADVSQDIRRNDQLGFMVNSEYRMDDYWNFSVSHNTYSLDVPLRARADGIEGKQTSLSVGFRKSERNSARATVRLHDMDDGNQNYFYSLNSEHGLWTRAHLKTRLFLEVGAAQNTETEVDYFSPENDYTLSATHMIDHTIYRRWDYSFVHRLYTGIGWYNQIEYDPETIWHVRYEHDYGITDWTALLWGYQFRRRYYDGEPTDFESWYLTFRKNF